MTYKELIVYLQSLSTEQLEMDVTVFDPDNAEYYPVHNICSNSVTGVLDAGHPYLELKI